MIEGKNYRKFSGALKYSVYSRNLLFLRGDKLVSLLYDKADISLEDLLEVELADNVENFWNGYAQLVIKETESNLDKTPLREKYNSPNLVLSSGQRTSDEYQSNTTTNSDNCSRSNLSEDGQEKKILEAKKGLSQKLPSQDNFKVMNNFNKLDPKMFYTKQCFWVKILGLCGNNKMVTTSATDLYFLNDDGLVQYCSVKTLADE